MRKIKQTVKKISFLFTLSFVLPLYSSTVQAQEAADEGIKIMEMSAKQQDNFGKAVAVHGNYAAVGAWTEDEKGPEAGAAYIYYRPDEKLDHWMLVKKITASDGGAYHTFGSKIVMDQDRVVVAAQGNDDFAGAVYVFERNAGGDDNWGETQKLIAKDRNSGDYFGTSMAIFEEQLAVGAYGVDDQGRSSGAVYLFEKDQLGWHETVKLTDQEGAANDRFGSSLAMNEETLIVGASKDNKTGSIVIFSKKADQWNQGLKVFASDGKTKDHFGTSLALQGNYLAVGADGTDDYTGAVYLFEQNLGGINNWGELKKIETPDGESNDRFGKNITMYGDYLLVGSEGHDMAMGATYLFRKDKEGDNNWGLANKLMAMDGTPEDMFGSAVALYKDDIFIGAFQAERTGGSYFFKATDKSIFASRR